VPAGGKGEIPREEKAHEGRGLLMVNIDRQKTRTLVRSKALKWGESSEVLLRED
jgi:hypothetical protein